MANSASYDLRDQVIKNPDWIGTIQSLWFLVKDDIDIFMRGKIDRNLLESERRIKDYQLRWIDLLLTENRLEKRFNTTFFTAGDAREPDQNRLGFGIKGASWGVAILKCEHGSSRQY